MHSFFIILRIFFIAFLFIYPTLVMAHTEAGVAGGLISGFLHPIFGMDHLVAMIAVGLWGAQLRQPAIWILPIAFPMVMALGAVLGVLGARIPMLELGVASSALALGFAVAFCARPPLAVAIGMVSVFAIFHGLAHGMELPKAANAFAYGIGFVVCTGLLHLAGIMLGLLMRWPYGKQAIRALGAIIALLGAYFVSQTLM